MESIAGLIRATFPAGPAGVRIMGAATIRSMPDQFFIEVATSKDPRKLAQTQRVAILEQVPLFEGVAKRHLRHIAKLSKIERFEPEQDILVQGRSPKAAFVVIVGTAAVRKNGRKIADVGQGDFVGELGLLLDRPRNASVRATSSVECLALDRAGLKATIIEFPALGWHLLQTVANRLSD